MQKGTRRRRRVEQLTFYLFIFPALIFVVLFIAYPIVFSFLLPFLSWRGYGSIGFAGFQNFIYTLTQDEYFWTALKNSVYYSLFATFGTVVIGFLLAVFIDLKVSLWRMYRSLFFMTVLLSSVVTGLLWVKILEPDGLLNSVLNVLHLENLTRIWLGNPDTAMPSIIVVAVWQYSGFTMIFFLAGMAAIDDTLYESARIDGASTARQVVSITVPLLRNVFVVVIMLQLILSFKVFDIVWVMTGGGPAGATHVLGTILYRDAFRLQQFGYASVVGLFMLLTAVVLSIVYIQFSGYTKPADSG